MTDTVFRIGTRNSPLAMKQADLLQSSLKEHHPDLKIEIMPILSKADWKKSEGEKALSEENGGKGMFAKEIEDMLLTGQIDCGVHSLKDMASFLPEGLAIHHVLPRANPYDAFISQKYTGFHDLPAGAVIGTCSARRMAIALATRPDIRVVPFRGNVQTRFDKMKSGQVDATFLAMAGIERLDITDSSIHALPADVMLPACGQGIICTEIRQGDEFAFDVLSKVHCKETGYCAFAERAVLAKLDGSCHTPIAAFAEISSDQVLTLRTEVYSLDGAQVFKESLSSSCLTNDDAIALGEKLGEMLNEILPEGILL